VSSERSVRDLTAEATQATALSEATGETLTTLARLYGEETAAEEAAA